MASIRDVARKAGVSISTVSNVINNNKPVSPELRERVEKAIKDLNYKVNPVARGLKSRKTNQIGVILTSFSRIFFPLVLKGIQETAVKYGYSVCVYESDENIEKEKAYIKLLENSWVDGIILASCANVNVEEDKDYLHKLANLGSKHKKIPVVSIECTLGNGVTDAVLIDNRKAAYTAVKHLIDLGHKYIAHIAAPLKFPMGAHRLEGYKDALLEANIEIDEDLIKEGDYTPVSGYNAMRQLLLKEKLITAVFAGNDQMAIGAIKAIREAGLKIPEDIAVIGFDNVFPGSIISPSLSSINVPRYKMGAEAMDILHHKISNPEDTQRSVITLETRLIVRQSTDLRGDNTWDFYGW